MDAAIITATGGLLATLGVGVRFVWIKVERRLASIEADLTKARADVDACKERHATDRSLLAEVLLVLQLVADEMAGTNPTSPVLAQIHRILRRSYPLAPAPADMVATLRKVK